MGKKPLRILTDPPPPSSTVGLLRIMFREFAIPLALTSLYVILLVVLRGLGSVKIKIELDGRLVVNSFTTLRLL